MEAYGYKQQIINSLNNIDDDSNNFYNYLNLNFLSKQKKFNKNLIIFFHGSIPSKLRGTTSVIFRGFNYEITNCDIVCISDYLLGIYKKNYIVNWTLETKNNKTDTIYLELFSYLIKNKKYEKIVFTGTSAGGYPSVKFASYFKAIALISNSQLYLENYNNNHGIKLVKRAIDDDDEVLYENKMLEKIILRHNPKKIIYYQNKKDIGNGKPNSHNSYNDFIQFKKFIELNKLSKICDFLLFENNKKLTDSKTEHSYQFPTNHLNTLKLLFNK